jgi:hypothetical protein
MVAGENSLPSYLRASHVSKIITSLIIGAFLRLVTELHEKLMQGVRGEHATPGEFRRSQNWIGIPGCTLKNASYVPPPIEHMMECLGDWEIFLHDNSLPPLVQAALIHSQFEAIHPFLARIFHKEGRKRW